jgi:hypothetical protein
MAGWHLARRDNYALVLRVDPRTVSIDLNRNGKFERTEQIPIGTLGDRPVMISEGDVAYAINGLSYFPDDKLRHAVVSVDVKGPLAFRQIGDVMLSRTRTGGSVAHFNGPLEVQAQTIFWELPPDLALRRGDKPTDIRVNIGTYRKADRCWTAVRTQDKTNSVFPPEVFPTVEVEFPATSGKPPVTERYALDRVC